MFVRFWGGVELAAEVVADGGEQVDLAIVRLAGEGTPTAPRVRAARVDTSRATVLHCQGVGYPWWKEDQSPTAGPPRRGRAQLTGYVPTAEGPVGEELTFHVRVTPRERGDAIGGSSWESASGTVVFAGDGRGGEFAIGVVVRHRLRDGASALTLEPIASIDRMDPVNRAAFREVLWRSGDGTNGLPLISGAAYPEPSPPAAPTRVSVRRILAACTAGIALVSGTLWWSVHQDMVADALTAGDGVKVVLAGTSDPGEEGRWWVLKDRVPLPKPDTGIPQLAAAHESAPMLQHTIRLTLEGNSRSTVMITDIRAQILDRSSPFDGSAFEEPTGGLTGALGVGLDMDEDNPRALTYDDQQHTLGKHFFDKNGFTLTHKEVASVTVNVFAQRSLVRFALVVSYSVGGRMRHVKVMNKGGKPFILSGVPERLSSGVYVHDGAIVHGVNGADDHAKWVDTGPAARADFAYGMVRKRS
ncbi:hypothetical protein [Streptomyces sp. NPDC059468]|uniref:hypothetical protein n=1 Tax=Streptomyces sp. NPDC059468 TaxID=3346845 RepID=UPI003684622B